MMTRRPVDGRGLRRRRLAEQVRGDDLVQIARLRVVLVGVFGGGAGSALAPSGATVTDGVRTGDGQVTISDPSTGGCPVIAAFTG